MEPPPADPPVPPLEFSTSGLVGLVAAMQPKGSEIHSPANAPLAVGPTIGVMLQARHWPCLLGGNAASIAGRKTAINRNDNRITFGPAKQINPRTDRLNGYAVEFRPFADWFGVTVNR